MSDSFEPENSTRQTEHILALLPSKIRAKAQGVLNQGGDKKVRLLTRIIAKERLKRRTFARITILLASLFLVAFALCAVRSNSVGGYVAALGLSGFVLSAYSATTLVPSRLETAVKAALLESAEPGSLGALLESFHMRVTTHHAEARENLMRLLPHITPEAFQGLTSTQRGYLYGTLNYAHRNTDRDLRLTVLTALQEVGDASCLGIVYQLATEEAVTDVELAVRNAARSCLDHLLTRLDFGPLEDLPHHVHKASVQLRADKTDFQNYATSLLTLSQLLPQLTPANYETVLSANHRIHLYGLLLLYATSDSNMYRYRRRNVFLEIIRTAERLSDTRAIDTLQEFAGTRAATADEEVYRGASQAIDTLEALVERNQGSMAGIQSSSTRRQKQGADQNTQETAQSQTAPLQGTEESDH
ncbi:MAG: hypothetical protein JWN14_2273 [Chthonomonadales bacterium]|nr:hypothetical protein [Chthonomonadales bacterium]